MEEKTKPKADFLFEISWEVCNKVGGINTVIKSKAAKMIEHYNHNYCMIGPFFPSKTSEFEETLPREDIKKAFEELKKEGVTCHYGKWLIESKPQTILIDFPRDYNKINAIKWELWEKFKIDSLRAGYDYDEPLLWGYYVGKLLEKLSGLKKRVVAHFHEWLSGSAILYLKEKNVNIATVFTTHATVLGRTLASNNIDFYSIWDMINKNEEIYKFWVESKHLLESASANNADVFTTVSEITAMEAENFLNKKPDIISPNGLDIEKFPTFEEATIQHRKNREKIREFLLYYFFPYYSFDLENTLFYFLTGRHELRDKGIDIFISSLGRLNKILKQKRSNKTIVAFVWVPANIKGIKPELLENRTFFKDIKDIIDDETENIKHRIIYNIVSEKRISERKIFNKSDLLEIKKKVVRLKKEGLPPIITHELYDENDDILNKIKETKLKNSKEDRVKIIFYPIYLSGADGLLDLSYYEAIGGCHLGIFPSFYEPWGYTPLEASTLGISSITTDLAGFGRYIKNLPKSPKNPGIYIIKRFKKRDEEIIRELTKIMWDYTKLSKQDRIANRMEARRLASTADWKFFIKKYIEAHNLAIKRRFNY